ncbi:MAG: hypothetical protein NC344_09160 [Bacteroidales bacterium]|nr:hypothetical protein [Bacteroidales bacterium]MCM1147978.1 hypothetical protein [Bacteroidales bacterium]MCM1206902.1 hypothetical protein [Bacillota bacterium]MCM1509535.1 hypothetical protein [Clostridium sp.]
MKHTVPRIILFFLFCLAAMPGGNFGYAQVRLASKGVKTVRTTSRAGIIAQKMAEAADRSRNSGVMIKPVGTTVTTPAAGSALTKTLPKSLARMPKPLTHPKNFLAPLRNESILNRFLAYARIESQSVDDPDPESFPMTEGQKTLARHIHDELLSFGGKDVKITLSDDYYIYVDIPSNVSGNVPSLLFMAHMDVTPEAPGRGIKPQVHRNYGGGDIPLGNGAVLSPDTPQGAHLKDLKGKTIITSDGTTLLGADDKTGCTILVTMVEELLRNPNLKHGRVMVMLSQNEDVGKAACRYDPQVFGDKPDIVIDVDGDAPAAFSVANFTAIGETFRFKGNMAHPSHGLENRYGDALTASSYFIGSIPPSAHPGASTGTRGYIHCYSCEHPKDSLGNIIRDEYVAKVRLRYFDKQEGDTLSRCLDNAFEKTRKAFPFVNVTRSGPVLQYENIAYSMPSFVPSLITEAAKKEGITLTPRNERGGTTSAMLSARIPGQIPGGPCIYSGQQSEHSIHEWCCVEEMSLMVNIIRNIITDVAKRKK